MELKEYINKVHKIPFIDLNQVDEDEFDELKISVPLVATKAKIKKQEWSDYINSFDEDIENFNVEPKPNTGIHGPQGTKGSYQGISFDSIWEYAYYLYKHDIKGEYIERNRTEWLPYTSEGKQKKFYPDFKVSTGFVEVKGIFRQADLEKQAQHPEVEFVDGSQMKDILKEVKKRFPNYKQDYIKR